MFAIISMDPLTKYMNIPHSVAIASQLRDQLYFVIVTLNRNSNLISHLPTHSTDKASRDSRLMKYLITFILRPRDVINDD